VSRKLRFTVLAIVLGAGAAGLGYALHLWQRGSATESPAIATDFTLPDLTGKPRSLADWRNKVILLNFWATWCPPCREEIPGFIRLQERYGARGLQIVGISIDNPEAIARFWQEMKINYPLLLADDSVYGLMAAYGNNKGGLPYSVLIGPDGGITATKLGAFEETQLENLLIPLLPGNSTIPN
jgi:peroxiredoxin